MAPAARLDWQSHYGIAIALKLGPNRMALAVQLDWRSHNAIAIVLELADAHLLGELHVSRRRVNLFRQLVNLAHRGWHSMRLTRPRMNDMPLPPGLNHYQRIDETFANVHRLLLDRLRTSSQMRLHPVENAL